jgi:hypothetical protein
VKGEKMSYVVGFSIVFCVAIVFTFLTIFRQTKFSVMWATLAFVSWFALAQITPAVFVSQPALIALAWLWYAIGIVFEILGLYITIETMLADRQGRDMQI